MTQSLGALQTLIDNSYTYMYSLHNDLPFNSSKSVCVVFKHRLYKFLYPELFMSTQHLNYVNDTKYLGVTLSCDKLDDKNMLRHFRLLYAKSNRLLRMYQECSYKVKLFHSYCTCLYYTYFMKTLHCIVFYCIVLYCIVLYCIMRPYPEGRLDRSRIGIPRELSEIRTQPWLGEGSFNLRSMSLKGTYLLIARRRNSITRVLVTISLMTCLSATCEPRTINLPIHIYYVASQPRTSDRLISHWRALCLLAHDTVSLARGTRDS